MTIFGWYILAPASIWKRSHDYHHQHNSKLFSADIGSYPIVTKAGFNPWTGRKGGLPGDPPSGHDPFRLYHHVYLGHVPEVLHQQSSTALDSLFALLLHVAGSVFIWLVFGFQGWLLCIFIPFFIGQALGAYLFYAQHNFPGVVFKDRCGWTYEGAAMESSSYMRMSRFMQWCTGNIGYHHIHHLNCRIPLL
jgi:omega-6 fatty acid desaturase (delta-12 desaturase)